MTEFIINKDLPYDFEEVVKLLDDVLTISGYGFCNKNKQHYVWRIMTTEKEIEEFLMGVMKSMNPNINESKPLMICVRCNGKYTLPVAYEECNDKLRDYCPNCVIDAIEKEIERKDRE